MIFTFNSLIALLCLQGLQIPANDGPKPVPNAPARVVRRIETMGTTLRIDLEASDRGTALRASEAVIAAVQAIETSFSTWRQDSELSGVNQSPAGEWVELSKPLGQALERALYWNRQSQGAFDPSLGALIQCWDLRGAGRLPSAAERTTALGNCGVQNFEWQLPQRMARKSAGVRLEEGGFGKGAALDAGLKAVAGFEHLRGVLDLGGQVLVIETEVPLKIAIAHPLRRQESIAILQLTKGSVATSGNSERGLRVNGTKVGHLLDGRTGSPAEDFGSVTVWCTKAIDADCLSTALYVMGPKRGLAFVEAHEELEALFTVRTQNGVRLRASSGLRDQLNTIDPKLRIEWNPPTAPPEGQNQ